MRLAVRSHPEWEAAWKNNTLPDEIIGPEGEPMSLRLHLTVHTIVERQLAADDPKGVAAIAKELQDLGLTPHQVRHAIGEAVAENLWWVTHKGKALDSDEYLAKLREIVAAYR